MRARIAQPLRILASSVARGERTMINLSNRKICKSVMHISTTREINKLHSFSHSLNCPSLLLRKGGKVSCDILPSSSHVMTCFSSASSHRSGRKDSASSPNTPYPAASTPRVTVVGINILRQLRQLDCWIVGPRCRVGQV